MFQPVYLDHNATTRLDPAVLAAMLPWLEGQCGNASSRHEYGRRARLAVDEARQRVAAAVNAHPTEVIFTSGGSEANNLFLKGAAATMKPGTVAVSAVEHPCVIKPAQQLARQGKYFLVGQKVPPELLPKVVALFEEFCNSDEIKYQVDVDRRIRLTGQF